MREGSSALLQSDLLIVCKVAHEIDGTLKVEIKLPHCYNNHVVCISSGLFDLVREYVLKLDISSLLIERAVKILHLTMLSSRSLPLRGRILSGVEKLHQGDRYRHRIRSVRSKVCNHWYPVAVQYMTRDLARHHYGGRELVVR